MAGKSGSAAVTLRPCEEQALHGDIKSAAAGPTKLTFEQLADLLGPDFLAASLAKSTPLPCRRGDATDKPAPVTNKRKIDETRSASRKIPVSQLSDEGYSESYFCRYSSSYYKDGFEDDEFYADIGKMNKNGDSGGRDVNGINREISGDLGGRCELGHGRREMNENGDNVNGNNRPMFGPMSGDSCGMHNVMNDLVMEMIVPLHQLKLLRRLGVESIPRILLHGSPGCGKTTFARAIANEAGLPLFEISVAELVSRVSGAPQENIRELFSTAYMRAPSIVFIDDIDAMNSKTDSLQKEIESQIVNQLIACMDEPYKLIKPVNHDADSESSNRRSGYVLVIGATNRLGALDPALRQRFDREIVIGAPCDYFRFHILSSLTRNLKVDGGLDLAKLAWCTLGFVARDLVELVKKASMLAVNRIMHKRTNEAVSDNKQRYKVQYKDCYKQPFDDEELENVTITMADFVEAGKSVRPSSKIECISTTPKAKWDDVGGLESLKLKFERYIVQCIKFPEVYKDLRLCMGSTTTFLLHGPPGCGKTLIVEALANEAGAKFIHVEGRGLMEFDGGPGELLVQILFSYARTCSPCILFFDELELIAYGRGFSVFNQLLTELGGGAQYGSGFYVIASTNRDDLKMRICKNFNEVLTIHPPTPKERGMILKALARNKPIDANVDLMALGKDVACENFSGYDLSTLMKEAARIAIDRPTSPGESCRVPWTIKDEDFKSAMKNILSSARPRK